MRRVFSRAGEKFSFESMARNIVGTQLTTVHPACSIASIRLTVRRFSGMQMHAPTLIAVMRLTEMQKQWKIGMAMRTTSSHVMARSNACCMPPLTRE